MRRHPSRYFLRHFVHGLNQAGAGVNGLQAQAGVAFLFGDADGVGGFLEEGVELEEVGLADVMLEKGFGPADFFLDMVFVAMEGRAAGR